MITLLISLLNNLEKWRKNEKLKTLLIISNWNATIETGMYLEEKDKFKNYIHVLKKLYSNKNFWFHSLCNSRWITMPLLSHTWLSARATYWRSTQLQFIKPEWNANPKWGVKAQVLAFTGTCQKTGWPLPLKWTCIKSWILILTKAVCKVYNMTANSPDCLVMTK